MSSLGIHFFSSSIMPSLLKEVRNPKAKVDRSECTLMVRKEDLIPGSSLLFVSVPSLATAGDLI
jgi:hypothetical protein